MAAWFRLLNPPQQPHPDERLARIETKIDMILAQSQDHESRIRALEQRQNDLETKSESPLRAYLTPVTMFCALASLAVAIWAIMAG